VQDLHFSIQTGCLHSLQVAQTRYIYSWLMAMTHGLSPPARYA
jgi:hypothetical protein